MSRFARGTTAYVRERKWPLFRRLMDLDIFLHRLAGTPYAAIAGEYGMSGEHVRRIVKKQERRERHRRAVR